MDQVLKSASSKDIYKFLKNHADFFEGRTHGDDVIFHHKWKKLNGSPCNVKLTINKKRIPDGTLRNMIRWSGLSEADWIKGLSDN